MLGWHQLTGDANELWNYEKIYEIHGRSIESQKQKEQEGYDKADRDTDPVWTDSEDEDMIGEEGRENTW